MAKKPKVSAYELPTPEKVEMGARLRYARENADMSQDEAAQKLGYSQAVQLSLMETGKRPVTLRVLMQCTVLYGTTMDYLCGLSPDVERDPAVSMYRAMASMVSGDLHRLLESLSTRSVEVARHVLPQVSDGSRLAAQALEAYAAMLRVAEANPSKWETLKAGSLLQARMEVLAASARAYSSHADRGRRIMTARATRDGATSPQDGAQVSLIPPLLETGVKA